MSSVIYKLISKKFDREIKRYLFTIEMDNQLRFARTAEELYREKHILFQLDLEDIYNVGFTHGSESVLNEKVLIEEFKKSKGL